MVGELLNSRDSCQFIVYACPTGELNDRIEAYLIESKALFGANSAHKYMPHCTLTGFFSAELQSVPIYLQALDKAYATAQSDRSLDVGIKRLILSKDWHGLELQSDGLKQLIVNFAQDRTLTNYFEKLRLKDWLHLSLAYNFSSQHEEQLKQLAVKAIDLDAPVQWELRFYQKNPDWSWQCLKSWQLQFHKIN